MSADLENGYADAPEGVSDTVRAAAAVGLAGCSIEDHPSAGDVAIYEPGLAAERIAAAAEIARVPGSRIVLTARAENHLHGRPDLADTISRLQAYQEAGADVVYAPGLTDEAEIAAVIRSVDVPVNVLLRPHGPDIARLASLGTSRISLGGALYRANLGAAARSARALLEDGASDFWDDARIGGELIAGFSVGDEQP